MTVHEIYTQTDDDVEIRGKGSGVHHDDDDDAAHEADTRGQSSGLD
jgi:hypothetical protein